MSLLTWLIMSMLVGTPLVFAERLDRSKLTQLDKRDEEPNRKKKGLGSRIASFFRGKPKILQNRTDGLKENYIPQVKDIIKTCYDSDRRKYMSCIFDKCAEKWGKHGGHSYLYGVGVVDKLHSLALAGIFDDYVYSSFGSSMIHIWSIKAEPGEEASREASSELQTSREVETSSEVETSGFPGRPGRGFHHGFSHKSSRRGGGASRSSRPAEPDMKQLKSDDRKENYIPQLQEIIKTCYDYDLAKWRSCIMDKWAEKWSKHAGHSYAHGVVTQRYSAMEMRVMVDDLVQSTFRSGTAFVWSARKEENDPDAKVETNDENEAPVEEASEAP